MTIPELKVIGVNNNQVSFEGFAINSSNNPNHVENNFIIDNLKPGEVKKFTYRFADRIINHAGAFSGTVTITVKNTLEEAMPLTVKYQDVNGNQIAEDQVINGYIGDSYDVSTEKYNLKIDGYTLKEVQGSPNGILAETPQTVTYIYEKNATKAKDVVVHYQDANGSKIADDQFFSGNVNAPYDVSTKEYQLEISGYTLEKVVGSVTGFLSEEEQTVTYVYSKLSDNEKNEDDSATIGKDKIPVNQAETPKNKGKTIMTKNKTTVSKDKSSLTADKLPKTGEIMNHSWVIIGLLVIIVAFFIAVIKHKRKK